MGGRQTLITGLALTAAGVAVTLISFSAAASTGGVYIVSIGLFASGIARFGLGVSRLAGERDARYVTSLADRTDDELLANLTAQLRRRRRIRYAIIAAAMLLVGVVGTSLYVESVANLCDTAYRGSTLEGRRAAMERARPRLVPLRILPGALFETPRRCEEAASDLARVERGECPLFVIRGVSCRCGTQRWPDDANPRCSSFACIDEKLSSDLCPEDRKH